MPKLKNIIIGIAAAIFAVILFVVVLGFVQPRIVHVERSCDISADPSQVYNIVAHIKDSKAWSPWYAQDTNMKMSYFGPDSGVGAGYSWDSKMKNLGKGKLTVTHLSKNQSITEEMNFTGNGTSTGQWTFEQGPKGCKVTWGINTDMGFNPFKRLMGLMFDKWVGKDFEAGLINLTNYIESLPPDEAVPMPPDEVVKPGETDTLSVPAESQEGL